MWHPIGPQEGELNKHIPDIEAVAGASVAPAPNMFTSTLPTWMEHVPQFFFLGTRVVCSGWCVQLCLFCALCVFMARGRSPIWIAKGRVLGSYSGVVLES